VTDESLVTRPDSCPVQAPIARWMANRLVTYEPRRAEPFHDAWLAHASDPPMVRLAHAIVTQWTGSRLVVEPDHPIMGRLALKSIVSWNFHRGVSFDARLWQDECAAANGERLRYLQELAHTWRHRDSQTLLHSVLTPLELAVTSVQTSLAPGCHGTPLYVRLASEGTPGLRARVRASRDSHAGQVGTEPPEWYQALKVLLDGFDQVALAYAAEIRRVASETGSPHGRAQLEESAARFERIMRAPAESFPDALQAHWLSMIVQDPGWPDSPCRFDQDLWPFLQRDLDRGVLSLEEAQYWVDAIWLKFVEHRCWSLTLSGQQPEGGDATNPLTWLCLHSLERFGADAPNVELRLHRNTPRELALRAAELLASGQSMPALVNDEPIIASMLERGIAPEHARDYTLVGCTQVVSRGRSGGTYEDIIFSAVKPLELALHNGIDPISGQRMGPPTGEPAALDTYAKLEAAVWRQVDDMVQTVTEVVNRQYAVIAHTYPDFFKSLLIEGCLERGLDYRRGGPLYTEGLADVLGITNLGDSLLVLRQMVYEQQRLTLPEFVQILDDDWQGHESFRQECLHRMPKFGNDDPDADGCTVRACEHINQAFKARERVFGKRFGIDIVGWTGAVQWGRITSATPDGRHCGDPLADSAGASQGRDRAGVTAALQSAARLPHAHAHGVLALNLRFAGQTFAGPDGPARLVTLIDSALGLGIQQMQINVVDANTLREAQQHPEQYEHLLVRVGGFSTYFNWLSRAHQDDIITRTEHTGV
jgi:trans-4-hydroxy-L-proline dehydratase